MAIRGVDKVRENLKRTFTEITGPMSEKAVTAALSVGAKYSDMMTPIDTSFLVNSRYRVVVKNADGWTGRYGYMANYAAAVHNSPGTLKGQPRSSVAAFNTKTGATGFASDSGNFWDPDGEPKFLEKGFEENAKEVAEAFKRAMQI